MNIREARKAKGEILLKAVGELPDEMVAFEDMEELKADAGLVKKQERKIVVLRRCVYTAIIAACAVLLAVPANLLKDTGGKDYNLSYCEPDKPQETGQEDKNNTIDLFAVAVKTGASNDNAKVSGNSFGSKKKTDGNNRENINTSDMLKEFPEGSTRKMLVIQTGEDNVYNNKDNGEMYIVFVTGKDIYFTLSYENSGTYILGKEGNKKSWNKEEKVLCNAGDEVYFDISGAKPDMLQDINIPDWKEKNIDIIAFVKMYLPEEYGKSGEEAGTFYIGREDNDGKFLYYGMYKSKDNSKISEIDNGMDTIQEKIENKKVNKTDHKKTTDKVKDNVVFYNNVPVYGKSEKKKIKKYLASLPDNVTEKKAKKMGIIIDSYAYRKKHTFKKEWMDFYKYVKKGEDSCRPGNAATCYAEPYMAAIVVLEYTVEGDACYKYISFTEGRYYVFNDSSRDKYKVSSWDGYSEIGTYKFLKKYKEEYKPLGKEKYVSFIEYSLFKKMDITNKEIKKILNSNSTYVRKYYNIFGYYK